MTCPISRLRIKNPLCGPDLHTYDEEFIRRWLTMKKQSSPITRIPMTMNDMIGNLGMKRLIEVMDEFNIGNSVMKRVQDVLENKDNKPIIETLSKAEKKKRKNQKQKVTNQLKKGATRALKEHRLFMEGLDWYHKINWNPIMPTTPSYSLMHSLREGFSIVMYSGTHRVNLEDESLHMHKSNGVRIHLPPWMCIIWHESLYHSGAKSRDTPHYQADMRFFAYIWPYVRNQVRNRAAGTMDGVARETGEQVYRGNIHHHTCGDIYNDYPTCVHCKRRETVVDLRGVPPTSFVPGERIIGDLEELGWMVVRGVRINDDTYESINNVSQLGRGHGRSWFNI